MILGEKCSTERQQPDLFDKVTQTAEEKFTDLVYVEGTKKEAKSLSSNVTVRISPLRHTISFPYRLTHVP
jgi:hypothetical protein